jgi:hypothetical protein
MMAASVSGIPDRELRERWMLVAIVPLIAIVIMFMAIAKSTNKLRTLGVILGWTFGIAAAAGLVALVGASIIHAGNVGAVAGDITGPAFTFTLLFSSAAQLRALKRVADAPLSAKSSGASTSVPPPPPPIPSAPDTGAFLG